MPELTVASTTDTDADVKRAANVPVEVEPEVQKEPDEQVESGQQEQEQEQTEQPEQKPGKSAFQKRIDRLTRERSEAEREAATLREQLAKYKNEPEQEVQEPPQVQQQQSRERPKPEDVDAQGKPKYGSYEDFIEDLADWKMEQKELQRSQKEAQAQWEEQRRETVSVYNSKVADFKKDHPDFDRIVNQDILVPQVALDTAFELGNPAIAYYLGQHPEVCKELRDNVNRPGWVAARIGQIDTLTANAPTNDEEEEPERERPALQRRSAAPPPIKPVGGSSTKSSVPLDEMPYSEYRKLRDQQSKARFRR